MDKLTVDESRKAFEFYWVKDISPVYLDKDDAGLYIYGVTTRAWKVWQAALDYRNKHLGMNIPPTPEQSKKNLEIIIDACKKNGGDLHVIQTKTLGDL